MTIDSLTLPGVKMMSVHKEPSQLAGKTVKIKNDVFAHGGKDFEVRDWWDRCSGFPWTITLANPVCTSYMVRASFSRKPEMFNNEVLYGRIGSFMYLIHIDELDTGHGQAKKKVK